MVIWLCCFLTFVSVEGSPQQLIELKIVLGRVGLELAPKGAETRKLSGALFRRSRPARRFQGRLWCRLSLARLHSCAGMAEPFTARRPADSSGTFCFPAITASSFRACVHSCFHEIPQLAHLDRASTLGSVSTTVRPSIMDEA